MPGTQRTCVFPLCGVSLRCMCMCKEGVGEPGAGLQTDNRRRRFPGKPRTRVPTTQTTTWATARACLWQEAWTVHVFALFESVCVGRFVVGARLSKFDEKWAAATPPPPQTNTQAYTSSQRPTPAAATSLFAQAREPWQRRAGLRVPGHREFDTAELHHGLEGFFLHHPLRVLRPRVVAIAAPGAESRGEE